MCKQRCSQYFTQGMTIVYLSWVGRNSFLVLQICMYSTHTFKHNDIRKVKRLTLLEDMEVQTPKHASPWEMQSTLQEQGSVA